MKIILGSKSPRRKELLTGLGYSFDVRTKDTDESYPEELPVDEIAIFVASKKTEALLDTLREDEVLLCADTTVVLGDKQYGKPESIEESKEMLRTFSDRTHRVITGVVIASKKFGTSKFKVTTEVTFGKLTEEEISNYIQLYQPFDKAGSYGIQEWIGYIAIKEIRGSYTNVVGLPTHEVYHALEALKQKMAGSNRPF